MTVPLPLQKRGTVVVGTQLLWYERSMNALQSFPSVPGFYFVNEDRVKFMPRWFYVNAVVPTSLLTIESLLRLDWIMSSLRFY